MTQRRLEGDLAAERVRMAEFATRTEKERYVVADRALNDYDKLLARWTPDPSAHDDVVRWRIDRLGALKARARTADVIRDYETLKGEGVQLPTYALRWVAASYLDQRLPEKAEPLYREVISAADAEPDDRVEDTTALFYTLQESDKGADAREVANSLATSQKPRVELKGLPIGNPNDAWMDAQQLSAQAGVYGGDLPGSEAGLDALVAKAPGNVGLRLAQADMYRARDLPRRAEGILKETEAQTPRDIGLEVSQAYTAMDLQEWRQMDVLTDDVLARNPDSRQVQRLSRLRMCTTWPSCAWRPTPEKATAAAITTTPAQWPAAVTGASKACSTRRLSMKTGACSPVPATPPPTSAKAPANTVGSASVWSVAPAT